MCEVCCCTSCASCCRPMSSGTVCETRKAARNGLTASRASGRRSRRMFRIEATASRLRRGALRRLRGQRRQGLQQAGQQQVVEGHAPGLGRSAQRGRARRIDRHAEVGVAAVLDAGVGHAAGTAGVGHHARHAEQRAQHPAGVAQERAAVAGRAAGQRQRRRRGARARPARRPGWSAAGRSNRRWRRSGRTPAASWKAAPSSMAMKRNGCSWAAGAKGRLNSRSMVRASSARRVVAARQHAQSSTAAGPPS